MSNRLGMDAGLVRGYADQMDGLAEALGSVVASVNTSVGQLSSAWLGADAHELEQRWQYHDREAVALLATHVRDLALVARTNAGEQDRASGVAGAGPAGGVTEAAGWFNGGTAVAALFGAAGASMLVGQALRVVRDVRNGVGVGASTEVGVRRSVGLSGSSRVGGVPVSGQVGGTAWADAKASASGRLSLKGADASVAVGAGVGAGIAASGMVGNRYVNATGGAGAEVVAQAKGSAAVHAGRDGLSAKADGDAYVGADAYAKASVDAGGVGGTAGVHGYAGIGVHADADASVTLKEVKASVTIGAALGFGGGVTLSADVHPDEVMHAVSHLPHW